MLVGLTDSLLVEYLVAMLDRQQVERMAQNSVTKKAFDWVEKLVGLKGRLTGKKKDLKMDL